MKLAVKTTLALACLGKFASGQIASFQHIVVIVQENRTPDNLFQGLCSPPYGVPSNCRTKPGASSKYDILTADWLDKSSPTGLTQPEPVPLGNSYDLSHTHGAFIRMYDSGKMDGAAKISCSPRVGTTCPPKPQYKFVDNSTGTINPYLELATQYGFGNYMFQTNQGPSFPAHQFLFGGTSAPSAADDAAGIFAAENTGAGCIAPVGTTVKLIDPTGSESTTMYPCFEHQTMGDLMDNRAVPITWKYYAPSAGSIWTAPVAIQHICESSGPGGKCTGAMWTQHLDLNPAHVLTDVAACKLPQVSWVIPTGQNSDHANMGAGGPSWVATVVNAIGNNPTCATGEKYWENTAIIITWDDWGGWYDHEAPTVLAGAQGDYQFGFRVPLIVVSAYTPKGLVNNRLHDFGSILKYVEGNFKLGSLAFADARATSSLSGFFNMHIVPRPFGTIAAPVSAEFFINDSRAPEPPDND
jgi:phospholipase C